MRPIVRYAQLYVMLNCPRPEVTNPIVPRSKMCAPYGVMSERESRKPSANISMHKKAKLPDLLSWLQ